MSLRKTHISLARQARTAQTFAFAGWISVLGFVQPQEVRSVQMARTSSSLDTSTRRVDPPYFTHASQNAREFTQRSTKSNQEAKQVENSTYFRDPRFNLSATYWPAPVFIPTPDRLIELSGTPPPALG